MLKYFFLYKTNVIRLLFALIGLMNIIYVLHEYADYNILATLAVFTWVSNLALIIYWLLVVFMDFKMKYYAYFVSMISLTFIIYSFFLMDNFFEENINSIIFHFIIPIFALFDFVFICNIKKMSYKEIYKFLIIPSVYLIYNLIYVSITNSRTYFFLDVHNLSTTVLIRNIILIIGFYILICLLMILVNNKTYKNESSNISI